MAHLGTEEIVPNMITVTRTIPLVPWMYPGPQMVLESRNFWEVTEKGWLKRWWVGSLSIGGISISFLKCFRFPHIEAIENTFRTFRDFQTINYYFNLPSEDFFATTKEWIIENPMASIQFFSRTIFDEMKGECSNQCLFQWHQAAWILSLISLPPNPIPTKCEYLHILRMSFSRFETDQVCSQIGWLIQRPKGDSLH